MKEHFTDTDAAPYKFLRENMDIIWDSPICFWMVRNNQQWKNFVLPYLVAYVAEARLGFHLGFVGVILRSQWGQSLQSCNSMLHLFVEFDLS